MLPAGTIVLHTERVSTTQSNLIWGTFSLILLFDSSNNVVTV